MEVRGELANGWSVSTGLGVVGVEANNVVAPVTQFQNVLLCYTDRNIATDFDSQQLGESLGINNKNYSMFDWVCVKGNLLFVLNRNNLKHQFPAMIHLLRKL